MAKNFKIGDVAYLPSSLHTPMTVSRVYELDNFDKPEYANLIFLQRIGSEMPVIINDFPTDALLTREEKDKALYERSKPLSERVTNAGEKFFI